MRMGKEQRILRELISKFDVKGFVQRERRIWLEVDKEKLIELCAFARNMGFTHVSAISLTDWIHKGIYEVTYHLWSYSYRVLLTIKTTVDRNNPRLKSVSPIWDKSAQIHERELHEMFGIIFEGNPDLTPLFLEGWRGPPPFRKDFNWREYVQENYYAKKP